MPIAEVAHQQIAAEYPEVGGRHGKSPGRVKLALADQALDEIAIGIENIDKSMAQAWNIIMLRLVLLRVGHHDVAAEGLDAERRVSFGQIRVGKRAGEFGEDEILVENIDCPGTEIGSVEEGAGLICRDCQALIDRARF